MKQKILGLCICVFICGIAFSACESRKIFRLKDDEITSLTVIEYDFETEEKTSYWAFENDELEIFVNDLEKIKGSKIDEIGNTDVSKIYAFGLNSIIEEPYLLCDNYLITSDGTYYELDDDKLSEMCQLVSSNKKEYDDLYFIFNHRYLSLRDGVWDSTYMYKSPFIGTQKDGIDIEMDEEVISNSNANIVFKMINSGNGNISFGERVFIETQVDNEWYSIGDMAVGGSSIHWKDILLTLRPGEVDSYRFDLRFFPQLPEGAYRIVKEVEEDMNKEYVAAEFRIIFE